MDPDVIKVLTYVAAAAVIGLYVAFVLWRVRVDRAKKAATGQTSTPGAPGASPARPVNKPERQSRAERKAAALAGTTPVSRPDLAESEARVLAAAARIAGREPDQPAPGDGTGMPAASSTATEPTDTSAAGASLFKPATAAPRPAPDVERATTVAELLKGIELPADLAPITEMAPRMSTIDRVAFATRTETAETVAPAVAAELERLGFTVTPDGYESVVIVRGGDRGVVTVHPKGDEAVIDGLPGFPAIPPGTVVVEVWIPAGSL